MRRRGKPTDAGSGLQTIVAMACVFVLVTEGCLLRSQPKSSAAGESVSLPGGELTPAEVLDDPKCSMSSVFGPDRDAAIVVVPRDGGARFLVVDEKGPAFGGVLAFRPTQYEVGRRPDGFLVAGFGGLYSEAAGTIPPPPEPAVVFLNGRVIYEHDDVAAFGIAADGSSFYAVETHSAESFSLLVRNLDEGREYRYDIGDLFKAWGLEFCYGARYSLDYSEVHLIPGCPGNDVGMGTHYFYKTGSLDAPAKITVEARER